MRVSQLLIVSSFLSVAACGKEPLSLADAKEAYAVTQAAAPSSSLQGAKAGQKIACADGGHVRVVEAPSGAAKTQRMKLAYEKCSVNGTTVSGTYEVEASLSKNSQISAHLTGELTFSGKVTGDCDVDVQIDMRGVSAGGAKASGSFCGQDVNQF